MTHNDTKTKKQGVVVANKTTLATITLSLMGCFEEELLSTIREPGKKSPGS